MFLPVERFIGRVTQRYNCLKYGHAAKQCKGTTLCISCGSAKNENHHCEVNKYGIHCKTSDHTSISNTCPLFKKQKKIKQAMVVNDIPFVEAKQFCKSSYSGVTSKNRFEILNAQSNSEANFPNLPHRNKTSAYISLSQPPVSKRGTFSSLGSASSSSQPVFSSVSSTS